MILSMTGFGNATFRVSEIASHEYERKWGTSKVVVWRLWFVYIWSFLRNIF